MIRLFFFFLWCHCFGLFRGAVEMMTFLSLVSVEQQRFRCTRIGELSTLMNWIIKGQRRWTQVDQRTFFFLTEVKWPQTQLSVIKHETLCVLIYHTVYSSGWHAVAVVFKDKTSVVFLTFFLAAVLHLIQHLWRREEKRRVMKLVSLSHVSSQPVGDKLLFDSTNYLLYYSCEL